MTGKNSLSAAEAKRQGMRPVGYSYPSMLHFLTERGAPLKCWVSFGGSGLGLTFAKVMIKAQGNQIVVVDNNNEGVGVVPRSKIMMLSRH